MKKDFRPTMDEPPQSSEPESVLSSIRDQFLAQLSSLKRSPKQSLVKSVRRSLKANRTWLTSWYGELSKIAEGSSDQRDKQISTNLKNLSRFIASIGTEADKQSDDGIEALIFGSRSGRLCPSLVNMSLMYVSRHYNEIYYVDTFSDILPVSTVNFVHSSVFVPGKGSGWEGSVGRAVADRQRGANVTETSFLDSEGVVACEDLAEGNISILMRCVYRGVQSEDEAARCNPEDVMAVLFGFFPLPEVFTETELPYFVRAVDIHANAIRLWCEMKQANATKEKLQELMQAYQSPARKGTPDDLLAALIKGDTQLNPVGGTMGVYYKAKTVNQVTLSSVKVSSPYLERELSRQAKPEKPGEVLDQLVQNRGLRCNLSIGPRVEIIVYVLDPNFSSPLERVPIEVIEPLQHLWAAFCECDKEIKRPEEIERPFEPGKLSKAAEPAKLAGHIFAALVGQMVDYIACKCFGCQDNVTNIRQIFYFAHTYAASRHDHPHSFICGAGENIESKLRAFEDRFVAWANTLAQTIEGKALAVIGWIKPLENDEWETFNAPFFWRHGVQGAKINDQRLDFLISDYLDKTPTTIEIKERNNIGEFLFNNWPEQLTYLANGLGLTPQTVRTFKEISTGETTKDYLLVCSLKPLVGDDRKPREEPSRNPVLQLATSFYSAILKEEAVSAGEARIKMCLASTLHNLSRHLAGEIKKREVVRFLNRKERYVYIASGLERPLEIERQNSMELVQRFLAVKLDILDDPPFDWSNNVILDGLGCECRLIEGALEEILENLTVNSIRRGGKRQDVIITIKTNSLRQYVSFEYSDNGKGFEPEVHARIPDWFAGRLTPKEQAAQRGLGFASIGMAVANLKGSIDMRNVNKLPSGNLSPTFFIKCPIDTAAAWRVVEEETDKR